jgi:UDP-glucuronate 4-epimerase
MQTILVTGAAGFIGFHLSLRLLNDGHRVIGIDNLSDYYAVTLKQDRLAQLKDIDNFSFHQIDLADREGIERLFDRYEFEVVVNLAAQAGVRYSIQNPRAYIDSNLTGFGNILEGCRHHKIQHLVYASSSSVYGANTKMPFSVHDNVDHPVSLYAATKKDFSLSMALGVVPIWHQFYLRKLSWQVCRSMSLITAKCGGTLPISMISSRGSSA